MLRLSVVAVGGALLRNCPSRIDGHVYLCSQPQFSRRRVARSCAYELGIAWSDDRLIAVDEDGRLVGPEWYPDEFRRISKRAGVRRIPSKGLRNTSSRAVVARRTTRRRCRTRPTHSRRHARSATPLAQQGPLRLRTRQTRHRPLRRGRRPRLGPAHPPRRLTTRRFAGCAWSDGGLVHGGRSVGRDTVGAGIEFAFSCQGGDFLTDSFGG
jgi:hypothetical protein